MTNGTPGTIVLIHGLWMTPKSWDPWVERFTSRGYTVLAPAWPRVEGTPEEIRRDPSPLAGLGVGECVDHYAEMIGKLDAPPILIGHSFGGLITQLLLDRGLGAVGVALGTAPPKGILALPFSTLRSGWPALRNPLNRNGIVPLSRDQFHYRFTNVLSIDESNAIYDRLYIPGTARVLFEAAFAGFASHSPVQVDFAKPDRAPLLLIAGEHDHISPPALNRTIHKHYRSGITAHREYDGRSHGMAGLPGWEEIADYSLSWALEHAGAAAPATADGVTPLPAT